MAGANIPSLVMQVIGNNTRDMANKMKTKQAGGMEAKGAEFRPVQGGTPQQNNGGGMNEMMQGMMGSFGKNMMGNMAQGQGAGEAAKGAAAGIGAAMSDERIKEPLNTTDMIAEVAELMNNYKYHYKPGVGEDPSVEYSGVMAQELLQVDGYRSCVFEDQDGLLKVDTGRLSLVNAGMIADISKRLLMLEDFIKAVVGGFQQPMPDVE